MRKEWKLVAAIAEIIIGAGDIIAFLALGLGSGSITKWIGSLLFAIALIVMGIFELIQYKSMK